jgi:hypothetical protein
MKGTPTMATFHIISEVYDKTVILRGAKMTKTTKTFITGVVLGIMITVMSGCARNRIDLAHNKTVTVKPEHSKYGHVSSVSVYQERDDLVISGSVRQIYRTVVTTRGHVDITVLNAEGTTLRKISRSYSHPAQRKARTLYFSVRVPLVLPPGATVQVTPHRKAMLCQDAAAPPALGSVDGEDLNVRDRQLNNNI